MTSYVFFHFNQYLAKDRSWRSIFCFFLSRNRCSNCPWVRRTKTQGCSRRKSSAVLFRCSNSCIIQPLSINSPHLHFILFLRSCIRDQPSWTHSSNSEQLILAKLEEQRVKAEDEIKACQSQRRVKQNCWSSQEHYSEASKVLNRRFVYVLYRSTVIELLFLISWFCFVE